MKNNQPSVFHHLRDIILLPFTVTVIVPYLIHNPVKPLAEGFDVVRSLLALVIFVFGLSLFSYTVYLFKLAGRGTLAPWHPTQRLVVRGPYQYCRNPMITGVFFILISETLYLNSQSIAWWVLTFFVINTVYFMLVEERSLAKRFGAEYEDYKRNVPRWIPKLKPYRPDVSA